MRRRVLRWKGSRDEGWRWFVRPWVRRVAPGLGLLVWAASAGALTLAMWAWMRADRLTGFHGMGVAGGEEQRLHVMGIMAVAAFVGLQIAALLVTMWGLRVRYRIGAPVSFAASGAAMILADGAGLLGLLVWMRVAVGVN